MILKRSHDVNGPDEELGKMRRASRIPITELNQHITCTLCKGYFIDATTIIECLHTFCRSCIVRYLETNRYCPVCDVQVHKSKPLVNIRPDKTLQDVVYKLVPRLFQNEMQRRREFYMAHSEGKPSGLEQRGEASYQHLLSPEETICLSLNYHDSTSPPRYLRCPAAVSIAHLQKLIRAKYDLNESHRIDILHNQDTLHSYLTLMDIAYIYLWRRKGPLELTYRIYENRTKRMKLEDDKPEVEGKPSDAETDDAASHDPGNNNNNNNNHNHNNNNNWKEVQLRISENGEISVTDIIQDTSEVKRTLNENELPEIDYVLPPPTTATETAGSEDASTTAPPPQSPSLSSGGDSAKETKESALTIDDATQNVDNPVKVDEVKEDVTKVTKAETPELVPVTTENAMTIANCTVTSTNANLTTVSSPVATATTSVSLSTACAVVTATSTQNTPKIDEKPVVVTTPAVCKSTCSADTKTVTATSTMSATTILSTSNTKAVGKVESKPAKHKLEDRNDGEPPAKQPKQTILNHTLGLHKLSNNHPLKKHSQMSNEIVPVVSGVKPSILDIVTSPPPTIINKSLNAQPNRPGTPATHKWKSSAPAPPCYMPKTTYGPIINVPKIQAGVSKVNDHKQPPPHNNAKVHETKPTTILNNKALIKSKPSTPIGYKTLRDPPKTWNPQISRANLNRSVPDPKCTELKNVRPPKFFKLRNNMPRYLGNPASGVKPMYQVHLSPEKEKGGGGSGGEPKSEKSEIKKHSIVKIDPKTLKPISERAPETSNLSRTSETKFTEQDLKINTSSVPIFNPLKLQSSPKSERKSPKSPHSPKNKSASPPNRREKLNLNFTPSNPFIPNLASPTMNPNQFLFSSGPPGFPSYDPRVMAAYHTFLYGQQRMAFTPSPIPGLNLDLNQRNNFDMVSPTSPKLMQKPSETQTSTSMAPSTSNQQHNSHKNNVKKGKDSGKGEKSLQNAVEKLTQNKIKEVAKLGASEKEQTNNEAGAKGEGGGGVMANPKGAVDAPKPAMATTTTASDTKIKEDDAKKSDKERIAPAPPPPEEKTNENSDTNNIKGKVECNKMDRQSSSANNNNVDNPSESKDNK